MNISVISRKGQAGTLTCLFLLFASCDPQGHGIYYLENQASDTVYYGRLNDTSKVAIDTVAPGQSKVLADASDMGSFYLDAQSVNSMFSTAIIYNDTGRVCVRSLDADINWTTVKVGKWDAEHHFRVADNDFR